MFASALAVLLFHICKTATATDIDATTNITMGLILGDTFHPTHYRVFLPAVDIALEKIHADVAAGKLLPVHMKYHLAVTDNDCGQTHMLAPGVASTLYNQYKPDVLFGPNCSPEAGPVADLAAYWNIPMLTGATTAHYLDNKIRYRTFTRLPFKQSTFSEFVLSIFQRFDWTAGAIIVDNSFIYWTLAAPAVIDRLRSNGIEVIVIDMTSYKTNRTKNVIDALQNRRSKYLLFCIFHSLGCCLTLSFLNTDFVE